MKLFVKKNINTTMSITFLTVPVYAEDSESSFFLFDLLLPSVCNDRVILEIIPFLMRLRPYLVQSKNVDASLSMFFENQAFSCFNFVYIGETPEINRVSAGITQLRMGEYRFPLGTLKEDEQKMVICLMKSYLS